MIWVVLGWGRGEGRVASGGTWGERKAGAEEPAPGAERVDDRGIATCPRHDHERDGLLQRLCKRYRLQDGVPIEIERSVPVDGVLPERRHLLVHGRSVAVAAQVPHALDERALTFLLDRHDVGGCRLQPDLVVCLERLPLAQLPDPRRAALVALHQLALHTIYYRR